MQPIDLHISFLKSQVISQFLRLQFFCSYLFTLKLRFRPSVLVRLPDCAVCAEGYAPGLGYVCSECSERRQYVAISIVLASCVILAVGGVLCLYFVGVAVTVPGRRTLRIDFLGLQSRCQTAGITQALKIIVVSLQIVSQVSAFWLFKYVWTCRNV